MKKKFCMLMLVAVLAFTLGEKSGLAFEQEDIQIHGFASQGYLSSNGNELVDDSEDGTWEFNEIGLNLTMPIMDRLRYGMQFFSRDLGNIGNNEITIDWAYLDYSWRDWLGVRAVKIKIPWGLYNKTRDVDSLRVNIFLPDSVYFEGLRDFLMSTYGTSVYGAVKSGSAGYLDYELFVGTGAFDELNGMAVDDMSMYGGGLFWTTPVTGLKVGATALSVKADVSLSYETGYVSPIPNSLGVYEAINANYAGTAELKHAYVLSLQYEFKNLVFASEYAKTDTTIDLISDNVVFPDNSTKMKVTGWYASIAWRALDWLELGAYYADTDVDTNEAKFAGMPKYYTYKKDTALSTRFDINEYLMFKLESHFVTGIADLSGYSTITDPEKNWEYYAAKISLSF